MFEKDPIKHVEDAAYNAHSSLEKITQPVLKRYPLTFSFLVVFALAAILHGFELFADQIELFQRSPIILILIGVLVLFLTGTLYKSLSK